MFLLPLSISARRAATRFFRGLSLGRRGQIDPRPSRLGQPDGDRLLGRPRAVLAAADVFDFLANEFARLGLGRLPLALGLLGPF